MVLENGAQNFGLSVYKDGDMDKKIVICACFKVHSHILCASTLHCAAKNVYVNGSTEIHRSSCVKRPLH